jgi:CpeT/CpcT family protein DUF1001
MPETMKILGLPERCRSVSAGVTIAALLAMLLTLSGCVTQGDRAKADLNDLVAVLPGLYGNPQQVLLVTNVFAPMMTGKILYVRETAAGDERRVFSERVWVLEVSSTNHVVATVYAFEEPEHWRGAADNPELFRPMLQRDLRPIPGCELVWERTPHGFSASGHSPRCPASWRLEGEQLSFSAPASAGGDGYYHFVRQGGEQ